MEDNFYQDEFESFLKEQADSHRMYPSDSIWRNIYRNIHGDKKWPALTIAAFLLLVATVAICIHFTPQPNIFAVSNTAGTPSKEKAASTSQMTNTKTFNLHPAAATDANNLGWKKLQPTTPAIVRADNLEADNNPTTNNSLVLIAQNSTSENQINNNQENEDLVLNSPVVTSSKKISKIPSNAAPLSTGSIVPTPGSLSETVTVDFNNEEANNQIIKSVLPGTTIFNKVADNKEKPQPFAQKQSAKKKSSWKDKFSYQVYMTASASYRKLREVRTDENSKSGGPVALNLVADVRQVVRHNPGNGLEAGVGLMYNVAPNVKLKTGIQFNMRQYSIEAFKSNSELATITLIRSSGVDTMNSFAIYRTNTGYQEAEIVNRYYQVSMPIGLDWQVFGNNNFKLNIGGSIQPTYQINQNAFILSSDFKNYTETTGMLRPWNINSSAEAYMTFKVGTSFWQLGPQVRYQHLSTMIPQYSIKEHLWDYGLKFGIIKPLNQ